MDTQDSSSLPSAGSPQSGNRWTIAVLSGGESAERPISLESGRNVARALKARGHQVNEIDPAGVDFASLDWHGTDCVFFALHGAGGEDGQLQEQLERAGVPFTGSSSAVSRLAFSKSAAKERFLQHHVPTPAFVLIHESDDAAEISRKARQLGFPLVVKPDSQGSSLGVTVVETEENLPAALAECFHYDRFGLLESLIEGPEFTRGLLDQTPLPLMQIQTDRQFFDYTAKYSDGQSSCGFEFAQPTNVIRAIETAADGAAAALGTTGLARVDLRLDRYGQPWVLEVNTIPGLTDHSLVPRAAEHGGIEFGRLCEQAVEQVVHSAARSRI